MRLSVGLETVEDILRDVEAGLDAAHGLGRGGRIVPRALAADGPGDGRSRHDDAPRYDPRRPATAPSPTVTINRPEKAQRHRHPGRRAACRTPSTCFRPTTACARSCCAGAGDRAFGVGADISGVRGSARRRPGPGARLRGVVGVRAFADCRHPRDRPRQGLLHRRQPGAPARTPTSGSRGNPRPSRSPAGRLGITYGHDDIARLKRLVSHATRALWRILLEADRFPAGRRAEEIGLVSRIVPDDEVETEVYARRPADRRQRAALGGAGTRSSPGACSIRPPLTEEERARTLPLLRPRGLRHRPRRLRRQDDAPVQGGVDDGDRLRPARRRPGDRLHPRHGRPDLHP